MDDDGGEILSETEQDPEVKPGLFQGDMALNNEVNTSLYTFQKLDIKSFPLCPI